MEAVQHIDPHGEDVLMVVDGDDWLAYEQVLERLIGIYRREQRWMTYGSHSDKNGVRDASCKPVP
jgi:hypothetical protein